MSDEMFSELVRRVEAAAEAMEHLKDFGLTNANIDDYDYTEDQYVRGMVLSRRIADAYRILERRA